LRVPGAAVLGPASVIVTVGGASTQAGVIITVTGP